MPTLGIRMLIAGIDEAGLGPLMGPLVTGAAVLRVPDEWLADRPWVALDEYVARTRMRGDSRLLVTDSKRVCRGGKLNLLERGVLAFLAACPATPDCPSSRDELLAAVGAWDGVKRLAEVPWYANRGWLIPCENDSSVIQTDAARLRESCAAAVVAVVAYRARVMLAGMLNEQFSAGLNKAEVMLRGVGAHLSSIAGDYPDEDITVTIDKQGGRAFYHPFLSEVFPGAWIQPLVEGAERSEYVIERAASRLRIVFCPRADADAFAVALASMLAKYLRERFMGSLNAWFGERCVDLKPTAGYYTDAQRWLSDTAEWRSKNQINKQQLIRTR